MGGNYSEITKQVGERLRQLRVKNGLSQEALALTAHVSPTYLGQLERGLRTPTVETLNRICSALGISLSEFFFFDDMEEGSQYALAYKTIEASLKELPANSALSLSLIIQELAELGEK